ncbi:MAG: RHS repeat-associated core domain-containing protein, partial [Pseudomonadales bacterium]
MVSPTATEERHYIGGSVLVTITGRTASVAGTTKTRYLHKDHLGSITAITDEGGAEVEAFSFDPWGKRRAPTLASLIAKIGSPWTSMSTYQKSNLTLVASALSSTLTNKGFTGHEQLDGVELIHMGGRVYDAEIGRFLSADPFVQDITNLQGLNRYSYVENNPLSYTDPSGFFLKKLFNKVGDALGDALSSIGRAVKKALVKVLRGNLIDTIKIVARYYVCSSIEDSSACAQIVDGVVDVVANSANGGTRDKHDSTSSTGNIQARYESSPWWSRGNRNASSRYILQIQNDSMGGPINDATRPKSPAEAFVDVGHAVAEAKVADG